MKTYPECYKCFERQARDASRLNGLTPSAEDKVMEEVLQALLRFSPDITPPEIAIKVYGIVEAHSGRKDPYALLKDHSNKMVLELYPELKKKIEVSSDKLITAVRLAVAGNVIDYGVPHSFDIEKEVEECLQKPFACFDIDDFRKAVKEARNILYILDNAGEIVFDKLLMETIGKDVVAAVRGKAIINDVTMRDAVSVGLDKVARVISSGSDIPGTVPSKCTAEFAEYFRKADLIISKGQGNYETLAEEQGPTFFIFKAKCDVVARHAGCRTGDIILKRNRVTGDE